MAWVGDAKWCGWVSGWVVGRWFMGRWVVGRLCLKIKKRYILALSVLCPNLLLPVHEWNFWRLNEYKLAGNEIFLQH